MKEFLEFLVKGIVKKEGDIVIEEERNPDNIINLKLKVDKEDMGIVIGKEGKTIKSLRNLLKAKAIRENVRVNLELIDLRTED
ncbi:hypothetical protein A2716_01445 [candidate division WWE3 bacterium RIFCSPHIGHO2_01_FULL_40_23]|uniref:RNA-binding protein KhpA n=1 Tax=candidate division WWE3 bacterium RIFCSPLOWO2_01_FULL_41_18 TaxID=1802625 RepID=A0A1F4VDZ7_UNCKA|nr:MAG: hypothetical protein A2716_01445 [candidate division WWE3 bacterium RIFCSPHIGHO2_01_FULL_40_23]OGC55394.1 MAG: hypothetical protein A3A78_00350 [candidate division WWE3 bacterium RIFCSPLOWO2_01_FULL_41_18]